MQFRAFKLRFRRRLRRRQHQVEDLSHQAEVQIERDFFRRLHKFGESWRPIAAWIVLFIMIIAGLSLQMSSLSGYYRTIAPIPGGTFTEGILGSFTNANPIYATSEVDTSVSRLIFSGLFMYDEAGQLRGDLAESYKIDDNGTTYTVTLKPNVKWQDGKPLTSQDVVFTYQVIQNPDAQSPLVGSWQGITVAAAGPRTVIFTLPNPLSSFPYTLTNGILPYHLLKSVPMPDMRSVDFNTLQPVGSGPFMLRAISTNNTSATNAQQKLTLSPYDGYHRGAPKLHDFIIRTFLNKEQLIESYKHNELTAMIGLATIPKGLRESDQIHSFPLNAATMVFFKNSSGILSDAAVRRALVLGTDRDAIIRSLGYPARPVRSPFLQGQLGYDPNYLQVTFNLAQAKEDLQRAGWQVGKEGIRFKDGQELRFSLSAPDNDEYASVAKQIAGQWRLLGADVRVQIQEPADFQTTLSTHSYDAVLHGITIGTDPDVFVYWNSTQADVRSSNRLNFSEYKSKVADNALEAGRTRSDPALRVVKYRPFLQAWQQDAPAVGLYQPRFLYITSQTVYGLSERALTADADRYANVENWMIRTGQVMN